MNPIIMVEGLRKTYGKTIAVNDVSFTVEDGEIFGVVGPNGAGKTTMIEMLEGLRKPDNGKVRVLGVDPLMDRHYMQDNTGIQLQQSNLPERMKVWEALDLYSSFYHHPVDWHTLLKPLGLDDKLNSPFAKLSGGQKQRLFIALALLPQPRLVFLDELTTGLDPQARRNIWDLIKQVRAEGRTIVLTTHFMEEAELLCDRVAILDQGHIVALDKPEALIHNFGTEEQVIFNVAEQLPPAFVKKLPKDVKIDVEDDKVIIRGPHCDPQLVVVVVTLLAEQAVRFSDLRSVQPSLEDVFIQLTGHQMRD